MVEVSKSAAEWCYRPHKSATQQTFHRAPSAGAKKIINTRKLDSFFCSRCTLSTTCIAARPFTTGPVMPRIRPKKPAFFFAQKLVHNRPADAKKIGILCTADQSAWISAAKLCITCEGRCGLIYLLRNCYHGYQCAYIR